MLTKNQAWLVGAGIICLGLFLLLAPKRDADAQQAGNGQKWEYKVIEDQELVGQNFKENGSENYNKLAKDGWEYAGVQHTLQFRYTVFKRPKK
jgi:hypothetical protein